MKELLRSSVLQVKYDVQETVGTLPEVKLLCRALENQDGIITTRPGRRLQGRAFSPEIQVCYSFLHQTLECHVSDLAMHVLLHALLRGVPDRAMHIAHGECIPNGAHL